MYPCPRAWPSGCRVRESSDHLLFADKIERRTVISQAIATFCEGKEEILPIPF